MSNNVVELLLQGQSALESDSSLVSVTLRNVVQLNTRHFQETGLHISISVNGVRSHNLSTPGIVVVSFDADIPGEKDYFTSAVNATEFTSSRFIISEVVEFEFLLELSLSTGFVVADDFTVVRVEMVVARWCQVNPVSSHPV